ncbi:uncharacterized protein LOC18055766, partial [Citrus clementina]|uniref:uncharacterized protein LOC18055766 n=1 Tax=Citrus clementina TaxID=85681 RepID=UPI000CECFD7D
IKIESHPPLHQQLSFFCVCDPTFALFLLFPLSILILLSHQQPKPNKTFLLPSFLQLIAEPMEQDYYNRSKSYGPGMMRNHNHMEITGYYDPPPPRAPAAASYDLRCYSASYAQSQMSNFDNNFNYNVKDFNTKKGKITSGSSSSSKSWSLADPEFQRKKRVASYKMYSVEGKVKGSFRKSVRWLKDRYTHMLYGWW